MSAIQEEAIPPFKPTAREEEILSRCVDFDQFQEEIESLKTDIAWLKTRVKYLEDIVPRETHGLETREKTAKKRATSHE